MTWYNTGTVAVTGASPNVVGTGTLWLANALAGDGFVAPDGKVYEIQAVASNTSMTLRTNYLGPSASAQAYSVFPVHAYNREVAIEAAALVASIRDMVGSGGVPGLGLLPVDTITGTSYTVTSSDVNRCKRFTSSSPVTVTIPPGTSIVDGFTTILRQAGTGLVTVAAGSGVTLETPATLVSAGQRASIFLHKVGTDLWDITGDLA